MLQYRNLIIKVLSISFLSSVLYACGPFPARNNDRPAMIPSSTGYANTGGYTNVTPRHVPVNGSRYQKLMAQFNEWRGVPHKDGGDDKRGIDCSAFVELTFDEQFHMNIPGTTAKLKNYGESVSLDDIQVGDLLLFKTGVFQRHVGIYLGNGDMLHVSSRKGVSISPIDHGYWRNHYWQSRRVF